MSARSLPRPDDNRNLDTLDAVYEWLRYLCSNTTGRGLGGHELAESAIARWTPNGPAGDVVAVERAEHLRAHLRDRYGPPRDLSERPAAHAAVLHLLGLSPAGHGSERAQRRRLAADELAVPIDTFIRRDEPALLHDAAEAIIVFIHQFVD